MSKQVQYYIAVISILFFSNKVLAQDFVTTWQLTAGSLIITLDRVGGPVGYTWETIPAGTSGSGSFPVGSGNVTISGLPAGANIRLSIEPSNLKRFTITSATYRDKLESIENWGTAQWTSMENAFYECSNLEITATDAPDLSTVSSMDYMFYDCSSLNQDIGDWNTSNITSMNSLFSGADLFNQDISNWDVGNVNSMIEMFSYATSFNQDIGNWNTENVTNMSRMLSFAFSFNQDISE